MSERHVEQTGYSQKHQQNDREASSSLPEYEPEVDVKELDAQERVKREKAMHEVSARMETQFSALVQVA